MKIFLLLVLACLAAAPAAALDGEIYAGAFSDAVVRAFPGGGQAEFVAGIEAGQDTPLFRITGRIETLYDKYNEDATFHPASIRYTLGIERFFGPVGFSAEHSCWHPVDQSGPVEEYNLLKIRYRFGEEK